MQSGDCESLNDDGSDNDSFNDLQNCVFDDNDEIKITDYKQGNQSES